MKQWLVLILACLLFAYPGTAQESTEETESRARDWSAVDDYIVQLQRARANRLSETAYDLVISDIALAGGSPAVLDGLRESDPDSKLVVAYMSIGQAAQFQYYWQPEWSREDGTWPEWAADFDGFWAGDVWVHYWHPGWQEIILTGEDAYIDRIIDAGFDGVLLDRVDAVTYYEETGRTTAYEEMIDFVMAIAAHARERSPEFGIFTINGEDIPLRYPESGYMDAVTGILVESLYYGYPADHRASPEDWTALREANLDEWVAAGKLVLTVDYTRFPEQIDDAYARSAERGYIPYVSDRGLSRLFVYEGHEPD
jgi:cysteinyl-tRNA synthetase, unknown class